MTEGSYRFEASLDIKSNWDADMLRDYFNSGAIRKDIERILKERLSQTLGDVEVTANRSSSSAWEAA